MLHLLSSLLADVRLHLALTVTALIGLGLIGPEIVDSWHPPRQTSWYIERVPPIPERCPDPECHTCVITRRFARSTW